MQRSESRSVRLDFRVLVSPPSRIERHTSIDGGRGGSAEALYPREVGQTLLGVTHFGFSHQQVLAEVAERPREFRLMSLHPANGGSGR